MSLAVSWARANLNHLLMESPSFVYDPSFVVLAPYTCTSVENCFPSYTHTWDRESETSTQQILLPHPVGTVTSDRAYHVKRGDELDEQTEMDFWLFKASD